jgi:hypothetical protein
VAYRPDPFGENGDGRRRRYLFAVRGVVEGTAREEPNGHFPEPFDVPIHEAAYVPGPAVGVERTTNDGRVEALELGNVLGGGGHDFEP